MSEVIIGWYDQRQIPKVLTSINPTSDCFGLVVRIYFDSRYFTTDSTLPVTALFVFLTQPFCRCYYQMAVQQVSVTSKISRFERKEVELMLTALDFECG